MKSLKMYWGQTWFWFTAHGRAWWAICLFLNLLPNALGAAETNILSLISSIQDLRELSAEEAQKGHAVRIKATATYCDPEWHLLYLQDDAQQALYVGLSDQRKSAHCGDLVELSGQTAYDGNTVVIQNQSLNILRSGNPPKPQPIAVKNSAEFQGQWIETTAYVRGVDTSSGRLWLSLEDQNQHGSAYVFEFQTRSNYLGLLDAKVRLRGVNSSDIKGERLVEAKYFVPSTKELTVLETTPSRRLSTPTITIRDLRQKSGTGLPRQRVHLQGRVLEQKRGATLTVADYTGTIQVETFQTLELEVNDPLDILGFPAYRQGQLVIEEAVLQRVAIKNVNNGAATDRAAAKAPPAGPLRVITQAGDIKNLGNEEARRGYPVQLQGQITYADPTWRNIFFQDQSDGIYLDVGGQNFRVKSGQRVEVRGKTSAGGFAPTVVQPEFTVLDTNNQPSPKPVLLTDLATGGQDGRWVEISGVVHNVDQRPGHTFLSVLTSKGGFRALIPEAAPTNLVNALVLLRGACGVELSQDQKHIARVRLHVPSFAPAYFQVIQAPPADLFALARQPIQSIYGYNPWALAGQRIMITGQVTYRFSDDEFILQDETGGLLVETLQHKPVHLGDYLEVVGFVRHEEAAHTLIESVTRPAGPAPRLEPHPINKIEDILYARSFDFELITLTAELRETLAGSSALRYLLRKDAVEFVASLETPDPKKQGAGFKPGAVLQLTGVCVIQPSLGSRPNTFRLLLRSRDDLQVRENPPWWIPLLTLRTLGGLAAIVAAALVWGTLLHRRVAAQTAVIRNKLIEEAALEARYRELFENANDLLFTLDLSGRCTSLNRASMRFFGYTESEALTKPYKMVVAAEQVESVGQKLQQLMTSEPRGTMEVKVSRKNGPEAIIEASARAMRKNGQPVGFQVIARDITERKLYAESLAREKNLLRTLIDHLPAYIYVKDTAGRYLLTNKIHQRLRGYQNGTDALGKTVFDLFPKELAEAYHASDQQVLASGLAVFDREEPATDAQGKPCWLSTTKVALKDDQARIIGLVGISHDITERRNLEQLLRQAQKMESVGQLAAGIAHDFNNILTVIQGHTDLLLLSNHIAPDRLESLKQIGNASQRAANLTRQLLTFSRKQILQPKILDLNELITNLAKMLQRLLGEHINLQFDYALENPMLYADAGMVEQVIMNLCVNARDAMPNGGNLLLQTGTVEVDEQYAARNPEARAGRHVQLSVTDTGCGMDEATLARIFDPFFTTKEAGKGTGLGLATVYGIVKQHQGWITVQSQVGHGSRFEVYFPRTAKTRDMPPESITAARTLRGVETILVVEDEAALRMVVERVLKHHGYKVLLADSGHKALDLWREHHSNIQIVLTDLVMPHGMSGKDLADQLLADEPALKIIYTSGYSVDLTTDGNRFQQGINFLAKPYCPTDLAKLVRECLDRTDNMAQAESELLQ